MIANYFCPVCQKKLCLSAKRLLLSVQSKSNEEKADVILKCTKCKASVAIKTMRTQVAKEQSGPQ